MAKKNEIAKVDAATIQPVEQIESLILTIRGKQVMLDRDLARLYGVETFRLNEQVKRNIERFPEDFMFQLTKEEFENWKSQIVTSIPNENMSSQNARTSNADMLSQIAMTSAKRRPASALPYAFTENGIAMLSSVLRSPMAIATNIHIMRAFNAMRHFIGSHAQVFQRLEVMERNQLALNASQAELSAQVAENNKRLNEVFRRMDDNSEKPEKGIFYDGQIFDAYSFINERIREAKKRIVLIDNYVDDSVLTMLDKRNKGVEAVVYTKNISRQLSLDFEKHNAQYSPIEVKQFDRAHDRFLCIDDTVYLIGASLKDLGKKWFGFVKLEQPTDELLSKM
ncbi:MAG: ORF6N domain-containing protein [Paludibacteraceae bacterium]|nr:ORF6N domain-containing protein [Paludibacteraceae bacterium]